MILSEKTGSRTIIYNAGNQEPLTAPEFSIAMENSDNFNWIHFEARPNVKEMLEMLTTTFKHKVFYKNVLKTFFL